VREELCAACGGSRAMHDQPGAHRFFSYDPGGTPLDLVEQRVRRVRSWTGCRCIVCNARDKLNACRQCDATVCDRHAHDGLCALCAASMQEQARETMKRAGVASLVQASEGAYAQGFEHAVKLLVERVRAVADRLDAENVEHRTASLLRVVAGELGEVRHG